MPQPPVRTWKGSTFGFTLRGGDGKLRLSEEGGTLRITVLINEKEIPLGSLQVHQEADQPVVVTFWLNGQFCW